MAIAEPTHAPTVHLVHVSAIKVAPWNPVNRISEKRLMKLRLSMDDLGLFYPVLIDAKNNLVDGHRRFAVAKSFGWKRIPCITVTNGHDHAYGSVQLTQQKLSGNDLLGVYLVEPKALIGSQRAKIALVEKRVGIDFVKKLYKAGMSTSAFDSARRCFKYTGVDLPTCLQWIIDNNMAGVLNHLIAGEIPPEQIVKAIRANKPIKF